MTFAPSILRFLLAAIFFTGICFLKAGDWDALGMGFMKIRFRWGHLFLIPLMALTRPRRGNWGMAGRLGALLLGALAVSYIVACVLLSLIGR